MKILVILLGMMCLVSVQAGEETKDASSAPQTSAEREAREWEESDLDLTPDEDLVGEALDLPKMDDLSDDLTVTIKASQLKQYWELVERYYAKPAKILQCCPKKWNYSCQSIFQALPCFHDRTIDRKGEVCCPVFPQIFRSRCLCRECARLSSDCIQKGHCARRYTRRWFVAICRRNGHWESLRSFYKWVPSSCYCKTRLTLGAPVNSKE